MSKQEHERMLESGKSWTEVRTSISKAAYEESVRTGKSLAETERDLGLSMRQLPVQKIAAELDERERLKAQSAPAPSTTKTVSEGDRFLRQHGSIGDDGKYRGDSAHGTWRKYRASLGLLVAFCERAGITALADVTLDALEDYRASRGVAPITWKVEIQSLRTFFAYCVSRKWIAANPAKELKAPRNLKPNDVVPYSLEEERQILTACDHIGGGEYNRSGARYEQLRAQAMVELLRHPALRISDVCTLRRDAISWNGEKDSWRVLVRTQKTGEPVHLPIPEGLKFLLDALPLPRNAAHDCEFFFGTDRRRVGLSWGSRSGRSRLCSRNPG